MNTATAAIVRKECVLEGLDDGLDTDWSIIERVLGGDSAAFSDLVQRHKPHVLKIVSHMVASQDVEEVAHEAFIRVFRDLSSYGKRAPFQHWLSKVTVRTCYDYWRKQRSRRVFALSDEDLTALEAEFSGKCQVDDAAVERARELLDWALEHLAPQDRLAFSLLYLEERSMKEVSEIMGWSLAQVKIRSFRARRALRKLLKSDRQE